MRALGLCVLGLSLAVLSTPASAQQRVSSSELRINNIVIRDRTLWYAGRWYHGWYDGRPGWWWIVGRSYYYYPQPVYPYPEVLQPPPAVAAPIPDLQRPAPAAYWNFCANPVGYYPYVRECATRWVRVLPQPEIPLAPWPPLPWPG